MRQVGWVRYIAIILMSVVVFSIEGCGTIITRSNDFNEEYFKGGSIRAGDHPSSLPRMYSGAWLDLWSVSHVRGTLGAMLFYDIPFSLAADTILLPLTAYEQIRYGNIGNDAPPIILAARDGDVAAVRALLQQGADANAKTRGGRTALVIAAWWGRTPVVQALLEKGADVNAKNPEGWTALLAAVRASHTAVAQVLLEKGADINAKNSEGWTALMGAAREDNAAIVKVLLDGGADVNAKNSEGWTALIAAAKHGNPFIIKLLLDRGADINAKTTDGWTALRIAAAGATQSKETGVVELLKRAGAKE
ncbi:MAG: hypothetical protein A4C66_02365 [Nitrospira sp. HN-bin3]|uniref:ankyrin repeat domain-containing protein n=1 Tax=Nitrospira cf. moscoviensis SBR1015 TaxID=96242 RepID=UPI000A0C310C|nr:ankyrin repeat domain-containing protein [Nitrospira cf. moscoviensis SBR1015]OQW40251.1 MAG: hypothetical protein A4C66_02365 [Nitrospira sp. HN-bin3]